MPPLVLLTVDLMIRDAGGGAAIVYLSSDPDFRTLHLRTSLCTYLPWLKERVLSAIAGHCCDIVLK